MEKINATSFKDFFSSKSAGGVLLMGCVIISIVIANTNLGEQYVNILHFKLGSNFGKIELQYPVILWINDGLMAIFFLLVGLEIKRELVEGELSSPKQAALPVFSAIGGMVVPAILFGLFNNNTPTANGWGIPMATDIAFAIAILSLLGNKIPTSLKIFLTALAIVDDLGAILVIALFYSAEVHLDYLLYAFAVFGFMMLLNRMKVMSIVFYILPGVVLWYLIHHSGIHATIAGVLTALALPTTPDETESPLERLEHLLAKPVNFLILPLFALANTNIRFEAGMLDGIFSNMGFGIMAGLLLGKPIGIFGMSWLAVKTGLSKLPSDVCWNQIIGAGVLAGIGFTMSIFIALLSYNDPGLQTEAKFTILITSIIAGVTGYLLLQRGYKKRVCHAP